MAAAKSSSGARDYSLFEAEISGAVMNFALLRRLLRWMRPYRGKLCASAALILVASIVQILLPVVISMVGIDYAIGGERNAAAPDLGMVAAADWIATHFDMSLLAAACCLYAALQLGWAAAIHAHRMTLTLAVINGLRDLRRDLFAHLETRPFAFYEGVAVGRVMTRVTNDVEALYELLRGLGALIGEFAPFLAALAIMFSVSAELTLILLAALPVLATATFYFRRITRTLFRRARLTLSALNQNMQENLAGLQVVQLSRREDYNHRRYTAINERNLAAETRSMRLETVYGAFTDSLASIAIGVVLWFGGGAVIQERITLGGMVLFTQFISMLFHPIVVLGEQLNVLFRAMASGERIFQALDWDERIHEPTHPAQLPARLRGEVAFRGLNFAYRPDTPVLRDVSLSIAAGEKLAIVGQTGSGKSTLAKLLGRFYDIEDGRIFLDGIDVNRIHSSDLRRRIGMVLQDFHVFSGTIGDNIALGDPAIDRERAIAAARAVNAHGFISALPRGYDTPVAERGQNLSQGQRQLLAFARVLAANPELLILDEATASIDTETERLIQDALRKLAAGRTAIIIAHRLQTVQEADRVLVLDRGRVAEIGPHAALLAARGHYYALHQLQFQETRATAT